MDIRRKTSILEKVAYQIQSGQGYGHLKAQGLDANAARAAVKAYYAQRGDKESTMLHPGDSFSRGDSGALVFQRRGRQFAANPNERSRSYDISQGKGAAESLVDRPGGKNLTYPMAGSAVAKAPKPAKAMVTPAPPAPPSMAGGLPGGRSERAAAPSVATPSMGGRQRTNAIGRMAGAAANAGLSDVSGMRPDLRRSGPSAVQTSMKVVSPPGVGSRVAGNE